MAGDAKFPLYIQAVADSAAQQLRNSATGGNASLIPQEYLAMREAAIFAPFPGQEDASPGATDSSAVADPLPARFRGSTTGGDDKRTGARSDAVTPPLGETMPGDDSPAGIPYSRSSSFSSGNTLEGIEVLRGTPFGRVARRAAPAALLALGAALGLGWYLSHPKRPATPAPHDQATNVVTNSFNEQLPGAETHAVVIPGYQGMTPTVTPSARDVYRDSSFERGLTRLSTTKRVSHILFAGAGAVIPYEPHLLGRADGRHLYALAPEELHGKSIQRATIKFFDGTSEEISLNPRAVAEAAQDAHGTAGYRAEPGLGRGQRGERESEKTSVGVSVGGCSSTEEKPLTDGLPVPVPYQGWSRGEDASRSSPTPDLPVPVPHRQWHAPLEAAVRLYDQRRRGSDHGYMTVREIMSHVAQSTGVLLSERRLRDAVDAASYERRSPRTTKVSREERLRFVEQAIDRGLTASQIAEQSGWSETTVRADYKRIANQAAAQKK